MYGGEGDDTISGGSGNDYLVGGIGNDTVKGGSGKDTYYFELGWGNDIIDDYYATTDRTDVIEFGEGISPEDIILERTADGLVITNINTGDTITVLNAYKNELGKYMIDGIKFYDGTSWDIEGVKERTRTDGLTGTGESDTITGYSESYGYTDDEILRGYGGDDTLSGGDGSDEVYGGEGDDTISGGSGNDYLVGGIGNDTVKGGSGKDTYYFELGWGKDTINDYDTSTGRNSDKIVFGEGISPEDIAFLKDGKNLVITSINTGDTITVENAYSNSNGYYEINNIEFFDGTQATIDYTNVSLTITYVPEETIEETESIDVVTDDVAAALSDICASDSITDTTTNTVQETDVLSVAVSESTDQSTDVQALLLAQELAGVTDNNNVFTNDAASKTEETVVFTEQYTLV